ncbi:hypothetical protein Tco_0366063 [Tanacetum coccineum]
MGDENPICTLGDYSKLRHEGYRNTIELPVRNNVVPLRSTMRGLQTGNLRELSGEEAWEAIENLAQGQKEWYNPPNIISEQKVANLKAQAKRLFGNEDVWVEMHRNITWDKVENPNPQSTPQVPPSFEETTPSVTHPEEIDETIGIPMEVEPLDETQLEDLGLNTCNHDIPLSSREVPSFLRYHATLSIKLNPREDANGGISNFTGRIKGMHVFIGNFTYVVDFMIVEDISSIINPRLSQVVLGRPFIEISNMTHDLPDGVVRFANRDDEVAYKMPHKIEQYNLLPNLEKEHTKSVYLRNEEDKRRGVDYVMSKILGFFKECLELGPEYVTGLDDEGEVTFGRLRIHGSIGDGYGRDYKPITKTLEDLCSQSLETASPTIHDTVITHLVTASHISRRRQPAPTRDAQKKQRTGSEPRTKQEPIRTKPKPEPSVPVPVLDFEIFSVLGSVRFGSTSSRFLNQISNYSKISYDISKEKPMSNKELESKVKDMVEEIKTKMGELFGTYKERKPRTDGVDAVSRLLVTPSPASE